MDPHDYLDLFLAEAQEHLRAAFALRETVARSPGEAAPWRDLLRHAHSLKGMAAAMGYTEMVGSAHDLEGRLAAIAEAPAPTIAAEELGELFAGFDRLARSVRGIERAQGRPGAAPAASGTERRPGSGRPFEVELALPDAGAGSACASVAVLTAVAALGRVVQADPPRLSAATGHFEGRLHMVLDSDRPAAELRRAFAGLPGLSGWELAPLEASPRVPAPDAVATRWIRVAADRLAALEETLLELRLVHRRLLDEQVPRTGTVRQALQRVGALLRSAHATVTELRLVPFESASRRLEGAVHSLAGELGREVSFGIEGGDVGLDRSVLEALVDPLLHLLRNAVDHGIEPPAERREGGKAAAGRLSIRLERHGDRVELAVEDDGRGMDPARLEETAVDLGLIDAAAAERLSEQELLMLATLPGLSTASALSHVSGRGMGLDVVRDTLANLGGRLEIRSRPGRGTRVTLHVPLPLALVRTLVVRSVGASYAIPIEAVCRASDRAPTADAPRLLRLERHLDPAATCDAMAAGSWSVTVATGEGRVALVVDEVCGCQDLLVRPLPLPLAGLRAYSGAAILADGAIALVLDPAHLTAPIRPRASRPCGGSDPVEPPRPSGRPPSRS